MTAFNYTGKARITWPDKDDTIQFIDYCAQTGILSVWPEDESIEKREWLGQMKDHPASYMRFLHIL